MWSVYVIRSKSDEIYYVGMSTNIISRINEHNAGKSKFTSGHRPWELIYFEDNFPSAVEARKREKYLKSAAGKKFISKKISE